jgi:hypothetical protein
MELNKFIALFLILFFFGTGAAAFDMQGSGVDKFVLLSGGRPRDVLMTS